MKLQPAIDKFLHYIEIEKNCSRHTYRSYAYDLLIFRQFVDQLYLSDELAVVCTLYLTKQRAQRIQRHTSTGHLTATLRNVMRFNRV
jgi:site-specific recombinase XerD